MEELRSTEILDKEILEDTRKKAERLLACSAAEGENIAADVSRRLDTMRSEKRAFYDGKIAAFRTDKEAALPLEKQRYRVLFEHQAIAQAMRSYFASLSKDDKLSLIEKLLKRHALSLKGYPVCIWIDGFSETDIKKIAQNVLGADSVRSCNPMSAEIKSALIDEYKNGEDAAQGIIVETEDKSRKCRVTVGELTSELLDNHSYELADTLFGGRLPE